MKMIRKPDLKWKWPSMNVIAYSEIMLTADLPLQNTCCLTTVLPGHWTVTPDNTLSAWLPSGWTVTPDNTLSVSLLSGCTILHTLDITTIDHTSYCTLYCRYNLDLHTLVIIHHTSHLILHTVLQKQSRLAQSRHHPPYIKVNTQNCCLQNCIANPV